MRLLSLQVVYTLQLIQLNLVYKSLRLNPFKDSVVNIFTHRELKLKTMDSSFILALVLVFGQHVVDCRDISKC